MSKLAISRGDGTYPRFLDTLLKTDLVILDDFGLAPLNVAESRDILEIIDYRSQHSSTIVNVQIPVEYWYEKIGDPIVADAILDRLAHSAHKLVLKGNQCANY